MQAVGYLISDPVIAGVALLVACAAVAARFAGALALEKRVRLLRGVWVAAFVVLSMWGMQQERHLQAAGTEPAGEATVAVSGKGGTRYLTPAQAFRREAVLWVVLGAGLGFALVEMLVLRRDRRA